MLCVSEESAALGGRPGTLISCRLSALTVIYYYFFFNQPAFSLVYHLNVKQILKLTESRNK